MKGKYYVVSREALADAKKASNDYLDALQVGGEEMVLLYAVVAKIDIITLQEVELTMEEEAD